MKAIKYSVPILQDGYLSLPDKIREKAGLTAKSRVQVV